MDVLSPELCWIGNRCYRVNILNENRLNEERTVNYEEQNFDCEYEADDDDFFEIESIDNGTKYQLKIHIPQQFHSQIIGTKGNTKKRLQQETSCEIIVPKMGSKDTNVIVKGTSKRNIMSAKNRLDLIVIAGRAKTQFTHFISVAFTSPQIQENFIKFKNEILSDSNIFGIDESLFQLPQKLHLTINTLSLLDNQDRSMASEFLQDCKEFFIDQILQGSSLKVKVRGIDYMNDDPANIDVLYAKVISEELQEISNSIAGYFSTRGFTNLKQDHVKMHVTLINSLFRDNDDAIVKDESQIQTRDNENRRPQRITFDASEILKKYKDFNFGEMIVSEIHLSQRYSKSTNGYYESTAILKI